MVKKLLKTFYKKIYSSLFLLFIEGYVYFYLLFDVLTYLSRSLFSLCFASTINIC